MMMRGSEGGAGGRGRRLTALGGALGGGEQALTQLHPLTAAVPVVGCCSTWGGGAADCLVLFLVFGYFGGFLSQTLTLHFISCKS